MIMKSGAFSTITDLLKTKNGGRMGIVGKGQCMAATIVGGRESKNKHTTVTFHLFFLPPESWRVGAWLSIVEWAHVHSSSWLPAAKRWIIPRKHLHIVCVASTAHPCLLCIAHLFEGQAQVKCGFCHHSKRPPSPPAKWKDQRPSEFTRQRLWAIHMVFIQRFHNVICLRCLCSGMHQRQSPEVTYILLSTSVSREQWLGIRHCR